MAVCAVIATVGCGPDLARPDETLPPIPSADVGATSSPPATVGEPPASNAQADAEALVAELPGVDACSLGATPAGGSITFSVDGVLYQTDTTGSATCLADLKRTTNWLVWSPDGDEVLISPDLLLRNDGTITQTGFFSENRTVRWSAPQGLALIAPKSSTGELIWRDAHDSGKRIDVSFADQVSAAAYHPAGTHIIAAAVGRDNRGPGLFIANNRGETPLRLGEPDESATITTDITTDVGGDAVLYIHAHSDGSGDVHRFRLSTEQTDTLGEFKVVPKYLEASTVEADDVAWHVPNTPSDSAVMIVSAALAEPLTVQPELDHISWPLGWLPGHRLLIASQTIGASADAPYDLWLWSTTGLQLVRRGVTAAAARTAHGDAQPPPPLYGAGVPE